MYQITTTTYRQKTINLNTEGEAYYSGHEIQQVVYNNFKQPVEIVEENRDKISFQYNAAGMRSHKHWGRTPGGGGSWGTARYHNHYSTDGSMEIMEDADDGSTTFTLFIGGDAYTSPVIWRSKQGSTTTNEYLYLHRDHLGSIVAITDVNGVVKEKRHFDAWGNIAKLQDGAGVDLSSFTYTNRGYTGHEHLAGVGLIHMNGRLYDPMLHRFLMPDNYIQDPYSTQNFNRYAYVLNNPLLYNDPGGEFLGTILTAVVDFFRTGFAKGGFEFWNWGSKNFRNAWREFDPTRTGSRTNNAWRIDVGMIKTDPNRTFLGRALQFISRYTWEVLPSLAGNFYSHIRNIQGAITNVDYYGGATLVNRDDGGRTLPWGLTLGSYINGRNVVADPYSNEIFRHEYGHTIQSRIFGPMYITKIAIPSGIGQLLEDMGLNDHRREWYETHANRMAIRYFLKHEPNSLNNLTLGRNWNYDEYPTRYNPNWYWNISAPPFFFFLFI